MPNCVNITRLEHLPLEETLLIRYTISCTGVWDLVQDYTAYRNVCDSEWTIMFPNIQQPRHSDFPLIVTNSNLGFEYGFAWNYGGIQGISAVDFNESSSYLVQLTLYEVGCNNIILQTGDPVDPQTPNTGGNFGGGRPGTKPVPPRAPRGPVGGGRPPWPKPGAGVPGKPGNPGNPGGARPGNKPVGPRTPRGPTTGGGVADPKIPPLLPGGGNTGGNTGTADPKIPQNEPGSGTGGGGTADPKIPQSEPNTGGTGGTGVADPKIPQGEPIEPPIISDPKIPQNKPPIFDPNNGNTSSTSDPKIPILVSNEPLDPPFQPDPKNPFPVFYPQSEPNLGDPKRPFQPKRTENDINSSSVIISLAPSTPEVPVTTKSVVKNSNYSTSTATTTNTSLYNLNTNPLIAGTIRNSIISPAQDGSYKIAFNRSAVRDADLDFSNAELMARKAGNLTSMYVPSAKLRTADSIWKTLEVEEELPGVECLLFPVVKEVIHGSTLRFNGIFRPESPTNLKLKLILIDSRNTYDLITTDYKFISKEAPYVLSLGFNSALFAIGKATIMLVALNESNKIVYVNSTDVVIVGNQFDNDNNIDIKARRASITGPSTNPVSSPIKLDVRNLKRVNLLVKDSSNLTEDQKITVVAKDSTTDQDYLLKLGVIDADVVSYDEVYINDIAVKQETTKSSQLVVDDIPIYTDAYKAIIIDSPINVADYTSPSAVMISITTPEDSTQTEVFISDNYKLIPPTSTVANNTVTATVPYAYQKIGLYVNGKAKGNVPANYITYLAISDKAGQVVFTNVSINPDDYYTLVLTDDNGRINPYKNIIHSNLYIG